jgi:hypothetical protein
MKRSPVFLIFAGFAVALLWLGIPAHPAVADSLHPLAP